MADDGSFPAKMELKLTNCGSLTPFSETVEFLGLHGTSSFAVTVSVGSECAACVDLTTDCGNNPRLIVLRPMSVQVKDPGTGKLDWLAVDASGISRDELAKALTFDAPGGETLGLGRAQFYFDGLIDLLVKVGGPVVQETTDAPAKQAATATQAPAKLSFRLTAPKAENGKQLQAVTVQFIAAYGKPTENPSEQ